MQNRIRNEEQEAERGADLLFEWAAFKTGNYNCNYWAPADYMGIYQTLFHIRMMDINPL